MFTKLQSAFRARGQESVRHLAGRYLGALAATWFAILLQLVVDPQLDRTGFSLLLIAILASAWIGGVGPGLLCQAIILGAVKLWFRPDDEGSGSVLREVIGLVTFFSVGALVGALSEAWQAAKKRAKSEADEAISQRERLETTIGCVADGVLVADADGRVTLMNPVAETMTGWSCGEAVGKPVRDVFTILDEQSQEVVENPVPRVLRDGQVLKETMRLLLTTRNDRRFPISLSAAPIQDHRSATAGVVVILRDETERYRAEEALRTADRRKDEFLATLAHELRNPLAPICMGLELMKHTTDNGRTGEDVRAMMERQANHAVRLIDDLLDVSRISNGKLELRRSPVELSDIVRNAVEATRPTVDAAQHKLIVTLPDRPVLLYADPNRLTQVLSNLLNNAAKYTPHGGQIELSADEYDGDVTLTVADNGFGIPADRQDSIFEMFTQIRDDFGGGHRGLGIGLTLVKRLVELHGGTVEVESDGKNLGSRFRVSLPSVLHAPASRVPAMESIECLPDERCRRRVLVVDDNGDALKTLSMLVKISGHEVYEARDGVEAVESAKRFVPDVVLMDIGMPHLNGYDAAQQIRDQPWGRDMVLIATTGWGQDEDRRRSKAAGFDFHLVKPIEHAKLRELLATSRRRVLERRDSASSITGPHLPLEAPVTSLVSR